MLLTRPSISCKKSINLLLLLFITMFFPHVASAQCPDDNHPHMVDLALPSGTKWACCNVGANHPDSYGDYFSWGETEAKDNYQYESYSFFTSWNDWPYFKNIGRDIARTEYDVAYMKWGDSWKMPTKEQMQELIDNCTSEWTTQNGVNGMRLTGSNGISIFLPASESRWSTYTPNLGTTGIYWSSELQNTDSTSPWTLEISSEGAKTSQNRERCSGILVRPVTPKIHSGYTGTEGGWMERVSNGNLEGDSYNSFGYNQYYQNLQAEQIVVDPDDATNHCIKMVKNNEYGNSDFYIKISNRTSTLYPGQKYKFSMRIKANQPTQIHSWGLSAYGWHLIDGMIGTYDVTTEWTTVTYSGIITDPQAGVGNLGFVFSDSSPVDYYFDDISFQVEMGDTFTALSEEGSELIFSVISEDERTCAAGNLSNADGNLLAYTDICKSSKLTIPSTVEHQGKTYSVRFVGDGAFAGNTAFDDIVIPEGVTYLGGSAFWISVLKSISIPSTMKGFGHQVFYSCDLKKVVCYMEEPFTIDENTFSYRNEFTLAALLVPEGTKEKYEATPAWNLFRSIVEVNSTNMQNIQFADENVKALCVANWDLDDDGELKYYEAQAVTDLGNVFSYNKDIKTFDELKYFTGLKSTGEWGFYACTNPRAWRASATHHSVIASI